MAVGWLGVSLAWAVPRAVRLACLLLSLLCAGWWVHASYRHGQASPGGVPTLKVMSWNMAHQRLPSDDLQAFLNTHRPDIAGLVEVGAWHGDSAPLVLELPPGYEARKLDHALAVVVRGAIGQVHEEELGSHSKFASVEAVVDGAAWHIFIIDGVSNPLVSRADILSRIPSEVRGLNHVLVMGDFNTPFESALFDPWRAGLHHAFNETGSGLRETWPRWVPVLTIDHIWSSPDVMPLQAEKEWRHSSDHAAILAGFSTK
jgi:endonuclease/exonuclease/phosphatase (EEP) superfamily protein YafD